MKTPIITIILFLALSLGILSVRIIDTLNATEPTTIVSSYTITTNLDSIAPTARAVERPVVKAKRRPKLVAKVIAPEPVIIIPKHTIITKPKPPTEPLTDRDKAELVKLLARSSIKTW